MSSTRYLEFDSTYRNRAQYPKPSDFVVQMSQSGVKTRFTAEDPVCDSAPIVVWNNSMVNDEPSALIGPNASISLATGTFNVTVTDNDIVTINISSPGPPYFIQITNFYSGLILRLNADGSTFYSRRILAYKPITNLIGQFTLDSPLPDSLLQLSGASIGANSVITLPNFNTTEIPMVWIPYMELEVTNFYKNYYLTNDSKNETRLIVAYDGVTRIATLESVTTDNWNVAGYNFAVRKTKPSYRNDLLAYDNTYKSIGLDNSIVDIDYTGYFMRTIFDVSTSGVTPQTNSLVYNNQYRFNKYVSGSGTVIAVSGSVVTLDNSSDVDDYYKGYIIYFLNATSTIVGIRVITAYNGSTGQATLATATYGTAGTVTVNNTWSIKSALINNTTSFSGTPTIEIESFTRDNSIAFSYTGTLTSSQQEICYEVELLNLILPNLILASGRGGRPAFYPYLYVELQQISGGSGGLRNIINSNNPNSTRMLFRAVVDDTPTPLISPFIKIDGDGMVQTIKFKPNDSFKIAIYHSDGQLFDIVLPEFFSPLQPNPFVQISACFAFKTK